MKKQNNKCPFCEAKIEIVSLEVSDIIVTSTGNPFPGPDEELGEPTYYWDN